MVLGTLGPLAALYHCNFTTGSVNSRVALYAALLVAGSGFVGRYIYSKIHLGLYGRRTDLEGAAVAHRGRGADGRARRGVRAGAHAAARRVRSDRARAAGGLARVLAAAAAPGVRSRGSSSGS